MPRKKQSPEPEPQKRRSPGDGTVMVRANGRIAAVLPKDLDPKRLPIYGPARRQPFISPEQATAWLDGEIARRRSPGLVATPDESLGSYLARWYRMHEDEWPERTRIAYKVSLQRWRGIGGVRLGTLTREVIQGELAQLRAMTWRRTKKDGTPTSKPKPYSPRTIAHARSVLHQALDDLIPDVLSYNPARARRRGRGEPPPEQPVWSTDQAVRFLDVAERTVPRFALAFRLILRRALRTGEVVDLTWADVDERAGTLTIDETPGLKRGTSGPPKSRRIRDVPLSADLIARLRAHRQAYSATDPHIFTGDGQRISLAYFRDLWHRTVRVAGVPAITPKDGRATCATHLLDQGWPLPVVAQLLGHATIATTSRFYARVVKRRAEQIARLGEQLDATLDRGAEAPSMAGEEGGLTSEVSGKVSIDGATR